MRYFLIVFLFLVHFLEAAPKKKLNENQDTTNTLVTKPQKFRRPLISLGLSAALPGLGQAYNKKYWKLPVVWGIMAIPIYFTVYNAIMVKKAREHYWFLRELDFQKEYKNRFEAAILADPSVLLSQEYLDFIKNKPKPAAGIKPVDHIDDFRYENTNQMRNEAQRFQSDMESAIVFLVLAYVLNVADAFADGYFYKYDVNEKLSFEIGAGKFDFSTQQKYLSLQPGLSFRLKF